MKAFKAFVSGSGYLERISPLTHLLKFHRNSLSRSREEGMHVLEFEVDKITWNH